MHGLFLSLRRDASIIESNPGSLTVVSKSTATTITDMTRGLRKAFHLLKVSWASEDVLSDCVRKIDGPQVLALLYYHLASWAKLGLLRYRVFCRGAAIATATPMVGGFSYVERRFPTQQRVQLSRFAYTRRVDGEFVLETALSPVRFTLDNPIAGAVIAALAEPRTCLWISEIAGMRKDIAQMFLNLLETAKIVVQLSDNDSLATDQCDPLGHWNFHDLVFHSRTRLGAHDYLYGISVLPKKPGFSMPIASPTAVSGCIPLSKLKGNSSRVERIPLGRVLASRRSVRRHGKRAISASQLGDFLHYVARASKVRRMHPYDATTYQLTRRSYPSGGATYSLELYVVSNICKGIPAGIFRYDPFRHSLLQVAPRTYDVDQLLSDAKNASGQSIPPQVLIVIACRFERLACKYASIAYALALKEVGALMQTMYLVAAAMQLAPCALGGGNSEVFAKAVGTDVSKECSVGEFMLGSLPENPAKPRR